MRKSIGIIALVFASCGDLPVEPADPPSPRFAEADDSDQEIYDMYQSGELEASFPSYLSDVVAIPELMGGMAHGNIHFSYHSSFQKGKAEIEVKKGTSVIAYANKDNTTGAESLLGTGGEYSDRASTPADYQCGLVVLARSTGTVWNQVTVNVQVPGAGFQLKTLKWSTKTDSDSRSVDTEACPPPPPPSGGDEGDEEYTCYTIQHDHYIYHTDTGYIEYVGTTYETVCEEN